MTLLDSRKQDHTVSSGEFAIPGREFRLAVGIFFIGFLLAFFFLQNLPFQFGDDLRIVYVAGHTGFSALLKEIINPLTPAWYVHGAENALTTRVFQTFLFKCVWHLFGYNVNAFKLLNITAYGVTGAFIYLMVFLSSRNRSLSFAAGLFFFLLPPVYRSISWMADAEILAQSFLLIAFYTFLKLYGSPREGLTGNILPLVILLVSAWLGIKLKETARILPFVFLGFILLDQGFHFFHWMFSRVRNPFLVGVSLLLLFPVVPLQKVGHDAFDQHSDQAIFSVKLEQLAPVFEEIWVLFSIGMIVLVLSAAVSTFARPWRLHEPSRGPRYFYLFCLVWLVLSMAGFTLNFSVGGNTRYLTTVLIPVTILLFSSYGHFSASAPRKIRLGLHLCFAVFIGVGLQYNLDKVIFLRNRVSSMDIADYALTKKAFEDLRGISQSNWHDLHYFYMNEDGTVRPEFNEIRIIGWDENRKNLTELEHLRKTASRYGTAYILSLREDLYRSCPEVRLLWKGTTRNGSLHSKIFPLIKKKPYRNIFLYKYTA